MRKVGQPERGPGSVSIQSLRICSATGSAAILCTGELDVIRKEAWPFYRTISGFRLCCELEEPEGPKGYTAAILVRVVATDG